MTATTMCLKESWEDILQNRREADSGARQGTTKGKAPRPTPFHSVCVRCNEERPRHLFKRWHGKKRLTFKVCNVCHPEKTIYDMTEAELQNWMTLTGVPSNIQPKVWEARAARIAAGRAVVGRRDKVLEWTLVRKDVWAPVLLRLGDERKRWSQAARSQAGRAVPPERTAFCEHYLGVMADLNERIRRVIRHGLSHSDLPNASTTRILPGVEKDGAITMVSLDSPEDWGILINDGDLKKLNELWVSCAATYSKGRPYVEPDFLRGVAN